MADVKDFQAKIETIAAHRGSFRPEAYFFVLEALERVLGTMGERRHISGGQLLKGIRDLARERFGPMAKDVLNEWGVFTTLDFGHAVFDLVEARLLSKTEEDSLSDFSDQFDFEQVFEVDYFENHSC